MYYSVFSGTYHTYTANLHNKYGEVVRIGYNQVFRKGEIYERNLFISPTTFSTTDAELNKTRRRQLGGLYSMTSIRSLEDLVLEHGVLSLIRLWDSALVSKTRASVNYHYGFHGLAFDVIGTLAFGRGFDVLAQGNTRIIDSVHKMMRLIVMRGQIPAIRRMRWLVKDMADAHDFVEFTANQAIDNRKKFVREKGGPLRIDILQKLLDARDPETGSGIDRQSVVSEIALLLVAGTDTTSNTMSWTLMNLMHYPDVYQRLRDDVRREFPNTSVPIHYEEARARLPYLTAVINECMRLNPTVSGYLPRRVPTDENGATVCGYFIPAKSAEICLGFAACHRNSKTWTNPLKFDPERFMGPDSDNNLKNVLAFSSGARMCIGRNLAWVELYTTLANILRTYNFKLPDNAPYGPHRLCNGVPEEIPSITFTTTGPKNPRSDCWIEIERAY